MSVASGDPPERLLVPSHTAADAAAWPSGARKTNVFCGLVLILCGAWSIAFAVLYVVLGHPDPDFFGFWSFSRFAVAESGAALYDNRALEAYEYATGLTPPGYYPYLYPPPFLLALLPLAKLPYLVARLGWIAVTGAAFIWAAAGRAAGGKREVAVLAALAAPTTVLCAAYGQNGLLTAALMLGGLRCLGRHDFRAGLLLGAVTLKPQLAILIPVAIIAHGSWRVFFGAVASFAALAAASAGMFGIAMWTAWLDSMKNQFGGLSTGWSEHVSKTPTVTASVLTLGGGPTLAHVAQAAAALLAAVVLWRAWRVPRGKQFGMAARATLPVATFLATPYAFNYDLPIVSGAIILVAAERARAGGVFSFAELITFAVALFLPALIGPEVPWLTVLMCGVLALLLLQFSRAAGASRLRHVPE